MLVIDPKSWIYIFIKKTSIPYTHPMDYFMLNPPKKTIFLDNTHTHIWYPNDKN